VTPSFAQRIAVQVGMAERDFQFKMGASWSRACIHGYDAANETYDLAMAPERELITMGARIITNVV
jgi:hypothetical protein